MRSGWRVREESESRGEREGQRRDRKGGGRERKRGERERERMGQDENGKHLTNKARER